ncbi:hypothetical protein AB0M54_45915 [Actinoplanes sp. NPDC051470]|uniref:hypothetical protein n=1 Tax=Actinoplanes sp. NPDC051470 TaxID=3157224 RepID=UPI0034241502
MLPNTAQEICEAAKKALDERIAQLAEADFGSYDFFLTFGAQLRGMNVTVVDDNTVRVTVLDPHFRYVAEEVLDVMTADHVWKTSHIEHDGDWAAKLTLDCGCGGH